MEPGFSKEKIVGLITILLIISLVLFVAFKIVDKNQKKSVEENKYVTYKEEKINMKLNGNYIEYIPLGEEYVEKGVTVSTKSGNSLSDDDIFITYFKNGKQAISIKTDELNSYLVEYTAVNSKERYTIYKTVVVIDDKAPTINFPSKTVITSEEVQNFNLEEGVTVFDNSGDFELSYDNTLKEEIGDYIITYTATDKSGNKKEKKRLIKVN